MFLVPGLNLKKGSLQDVTFLQALRCASGLIGAGTMRINQQMGECRGRGGWLTTPNVIPRRGGVPYPAS